MSAKLSRRFGQIAETLVMRRLGVDDFVAINRLTARRGLEFADLPPRFQNLVLDAEREKWGDRAEALIAKQFGHASLQKAPAA